MENTEPKQQNVSSADPKALKGLFEEEGAKPISHYGKKNHALLVSSNSH